MRILSATPPRRGALIEWEQSVTDETSDSRPVRLHSCRLRDGSFCDGETWIVLCHH